MSGTVLIGIIMWALTMRSQTSGKKDEYPTGSAQRIQSYDRSVPTGRFCRQRTHTSFTLVVSGQYRTVEISLGKRTSRRQEIAHRKHGDKPNWTSGVSLKDQCCWNWERGKHGAAGDEWDRVGRDQIGILDSMLRSLHFILPITENHRKTMVCAVEGSLDRGQERGREITEGLLGHARWLGQMNEQTDKWMSLWMKGANDFCWSFCSHEKGKWLSFSARPRHSWMVSLFCTHVCLLLKYWDLSAAAWASYIVLVICKQFILWGKCANQLSQNPQGSQAENRNKQLRYSMDQNSHQLELFLDCCDLRRVKMRMLRWGQC